MKKALVIRDAQTGNEIHRIDGQWLFALSADAKVFALATESGIVQLRDLATGKIVRQLVKPAPFTNIHAITLSHDGKLLAVTGNRNVDLWSVETGKLVRKFSEWERPVFSPDSKLLALSEGYERSRRMLIWDLVHDREQRLFDKESAYEIATFHPAGKLFFMTAARHGDHNLHVLDVATGKRVGGQTHTDVVNAIAFSPDGRMLASAGCDKMFRIWDPRTGSELHRHEAMDWGVSVAFASDGRSLALGMGDGTIGSWRPGEAPKVVKTLAPALVAVACTPDGSLVACGGSDASIHVWDVHKADPPRRIVIPADNVPALVFAPDGKTLVGYCQPKFRRLTIVRIDPRKETILNQHNIGESGFGCILSPDGQLAAYSNGSAVHLHSTDDGGHIPFTRPTGTMIRLTSDRRKMVTATSERIRKRVIIRLCEVASGIQLLTLELPLEDLVCMDLAPDGRLLATGSADGSILIWNLASADFDAVVAKPWTPEAAEQLWKDLSSSDGPTAYRAHWSLVAGGGKSVALIKARLGRSVIPLDEKQFAKLLWKMSLGSVVEIEGAMREFVGGGDLARQHFARTICSGRSIPEFAQQAVRQLRLRAGLMHGEPLRAVRAVAVLEHIGSKESIGVIEELARGNPDSFLTHEAIDALHRLQWFRNK